MDSLRNTIAVFTNGHTYLDVKYDLVIIVDQFPAQRFLEVFKLPFESIGFKMHKYWDWETMRKVYSGMSDPCKNPDSYRLYQHMRQDVVVIFPDRIINLKGNLLTGT